MICMARLLLSSSGPVLGSTGGFLNSPNRVCMLYPSLMNCDTASSRTSLFGSTALCVCSRRIATDHSFFTSMDPPSVHRLNEGTIHDPPCKAPIQTSIPLTIDPDNHRGPSTSTKQPDLRTIALPSLGTSPPDPWFELSLSLGYMGRVGGFAGREGGVQMNAGGAGGSLLTFDGTLRTGSRYLV